MRLYRGNEKETDRQAQLVVRLKLVREGGDGEEEVGRGGGGRKREREGELSVGCDTWSSLDV